MVTITPETKEFFESLTMPLALYQKVGTSIIAIMVSDGLCEMMKTEREELIDVLNNRLFERVHPDDALRIGQNARDFSLHLCDYDVFYRAKYDVDGDYHYIHSIGKVIPPAEDGTEQAIFFYTDVTESENQSRLLLENYKTFENDHFYSDPVTGLPNLNFMMAFSEKIINNVRNDGNNPAIAYFDLVGLRYYNSQYGFTKGDELLRLVGNVLKSEFPGAYVGRAADDHFALVTNIEDKEKFDQKIREANEKIKTGAFGNTAGIQAGVCLIENDMTLNNAMDHAKHALRLIGNDLNITYLFYTHENEEKYWEQRYIVENFEKALRENWIKVYYQTIVRTKTGKATSMEALARWVDPVRGMIMPGDFIPMLDQYHMLYKLDLYIAEQICKEIPLRQKIGLPIIPASVNFSAQDFEHADIVQSLNEIFERYQVDKKNLIVEITEQDMAKASEDFKQQIQNLRESGFRIWLDDFGSGYSSLNMFSQCKTDLIKFDIDFLRHLDDNDGANRFIMESMVDIAGKLGILTLAEGVENEEQLEFLRQIGCDFAQGFYFCRPESLDAIAFKIQNGGSIIACESEEEYQQFLKDYQNKIDRKWVLTEK